MAIARKTSIRENDVVKLERAVGRWPAGTEGTVLSDHGISKLIEIADDRGQMLDLFEVREEDLKLVAQHQR
ncbi:MAG TPA: hypothetical protein VK480_11145 [Solirubrobacterales bacterium]|nr:hypothetical protein [Solirubrobacterales bacterium]